MDLSEVTTLALMREISRRGKKPNGMPLSLQCHLLETMLREYVKAAGRMRDDWSESDERGKNDLWKGLHSLEESAREVLDQVKEARALLAQEGE